MWGKEDMGSYPKSHDLLSDLKGESTSPYTYPNIPVIAPVVQT